MKRAQQKTIEHIGMFMCEFHTTFKKSIIIV